ncbi:MAG: hypothetical protein NTY74_14720 [Ignavibacteriae bacterium]|nr:hypothetical protein [Ignavibacteriota bacterium]
MIWPELTKSNAISAFYDLFPDDNTVCPVVEKFSSQNHQELRDVLSNKFVECKQNGKNEFSIDLVMSLAFYEYLKPGVNIDMRTLASNEFWYWISIKLIPDLIFKRYPNMNKASLEKRFFDRVTRMWPFMMWWGAHLIWQGDYDKTLNILQNGFTVTAFETLLDRGGRGYREDLFRAIALKYSNIFRDYRTNDKVLLRQVITLNSLRINNIEPVFYTGGIEGYVNELFEPFITNLKKK